MSEDFLMHYGVPRRSGRYPYGSGENPYQHPYQARSDSVEKILNGDLKTMYTEYKKLRADGYSQQDICKEWDVPSTYLRARISAAKEEEMSERNAQVIDLKRHGYSNVEIGKQLGINESVVRLAIKQHEEGKVGEAKQTANYIQNKIDNLGAVDVGIGTERPLGISRTKMDTAIEILVDRGYEKHNIKIEQATNPGKFTTVEVLAPPGTEWKDLYFNPGKINQLEGTSDDGGETFRDTLYPESISSKRVGIRYAEDGGKERDGLIELRRGVNDISLGNSKYAQCRILVDGTHYIKGMAVYSDDLPDGIDILFNTNKHSDVDKMDVLKPVKSDPDNPFGALIKADGQTVYKGKDGKDHISVVNKVREEGDWEDYSKNLSSQFLSKQPLTLIKSQLNLAKLEKEDEYNDIVTLTNNPTVKKELLYSFADDCDAAAVKLKAAALPRQSTKVLIPIDSLKDNECYCPSLRNGEDVALIRYPHGGTFEIPIVKVNNHNKQGIDILGNDSLDAIGINTKVAQKLSGADFDGDTVVAIPINDKVKIKTSTLKEIEGFDPSEMYPKRPGCKLILTDKQKQSEMGKVSNLITDMTLRGATSDEIARAVKHSMVVIDAQKHELDYIRSEEENGIKALKAKYQGGANRGASTLISKANSDIRVDERKYSKIDPETGEKVWVESGRTYIKDKYDKNGNYISSETKKYKTKIPKMEYVKDAYDLSSGTNVEAAYADYANAMKALANKARKEAYYIRPMETTKEAKQKYKTERESLEYKLDLALRNAPKERAAQLYSASIVQEKKKKHKEEVDNVIKDLKAKGASQDEIKKAIKDKDWSKDQRTKEAQRALTTGRARYGAKMSGEKGASIKISPNEWNAIQNGAISSNQLKKIMANTDKELIKQYAMPRNENVISDIKKQRIKAMLDRGFTLQEVADANGVSTSTVSNIAKK